MGVQIILVLETNPREQIDLIYINEMLDYFFDGARKSNNIKFSPVFMSGKGNYKKASTTKKISEKIKAYKPIGESHVVYCFDTDKFDSDREASVFMRTVEEYCAKNEFEFAWFCHDVEEVFWGHSVNKNEKYDYAKKFTKSNEIKNVDFKKLCCSKKGKSTSNLATIIEKLLKNVNSEEISE